MPLTKYINAGVMPREEEGNKGQTAKSDTEQVKIWLVWMVWGK